MNPLLFSILWKVIFSWIYFLHSTEVGIIHSNPCLNIDLWDKNSHWTHLSLDSFRLQLTNISILKRHSHHSIRYVCRSGSNFMRVFVIFYLSIGTSPGECWCFCLRLERNIFFNMISQTPTCTLSPSALSDLSSLALWAFTQGAQPNKHCTNKDLSHSAMEWAAWRTGRAHESANAVQRGTAKKQQFIKKKIFLNDGVKRGVRAKYYINSEKRRWRKGVTVSSHTFPHVYISLYTRSYCC